MSDIQCNPYIFFKGNCREAMDFYTAVFGGNLTLQTYGDVNAANEDMSEEKIMHALLTGGAITLMASDTALASPKAAKISISLSGTDADELTTLFNGLSKDVEVEHPLKKEFWGDTFGSLTDKYGVEWMVNIEATKA